MRRLLESQAPARTSCPGHSPNERRERPPARGHSLGGSRSYLPLRSSVLGHRDVRQGVKVQECVCLEETQGQSDRMGSRSAIQLFPVGSVKERGESACTCAFDV